MKEQFHMIQYIHEGPTVLKRTLEKNSAAIQSLSQSVHDRQIMRVVICGLGSSYTAALMAAPVFNYHWPYKTMILPASELFYYKSRIMDERTLLIAVSRSGERGVVVDVLREILQAGGLGIAITGVEDSLLAKNSQFTLLTCEGEEKAFPKTKSVLASAGLLMALGCSLANEDDLEARNRLEMLHRLPEEIGRTIIEIEPQIPLLIPFIREHDYVGVAGTGSNQGVALEAAIKIQEAAYIFTRGDSTAGWLHGPVGALHDRCLMIPMVMKDDQEISKKMLLLSRKFDAHILCLQSPHLEMDEFCDCSLTISADVGSLLSALVYLPPIQLITYYWAVDQGLDPDKPRLMQPILDAILPPNREEPDRD